MIRYFVQRTKCFISKVCLFLLMNVVLSQTELRTTNILRVDSNLQPSNVNSIP